MYLPVWVKSCRSDRGRLHGWQVCWCSCVVDPLLPSDNDRTSARTLNHFTGAQGLEVHSSLPGWALLNFWEAEFETSGVGILHNGAVHHWPLLQSSSDGQSQASLEVAPCSVQGLVGLVAHGLHAGLGEALVLAINQCTHHPLHCQVHEALHRAARQGSQFTRQKKICKISTSFQKRINVCGLPAFAV